MLIALLFLIAFGDLSLLGPRNGATFAAPEWVAFEMIGGEDYQFFFARAAARSAHRRVRSAPACH